MLALDSYDLQIAVSRKLTSLAHFLTPFNWMTTAFQVNLHSPRSATPIYLRHCYLAYLDKMVFQKLGATSSAHTPFSYSTTHQAFPVFEILVLSTI